MSPRLIAHLPGWLLVGLDAGPRPQHTERRFLLAGTVDGSPISTPDLDALAADGLRYNNMHTTALCSPTRSCFITGRNHHSNGMSCITEGSTGYHNGNIPFENGMLSEILLQNGYNT
jgi:arylsulfatase A-like enzyme